MIIDDEYLEPEIQEETSTGKLLMQIMFNQLLHNLNQHELMNIEISDDALIRKITSHSATKCTEIYWQGSLTKDQLQSLYDVIPNNNIIQFIEFSNINLSDISMCELLGKTIAKIKTNAADQNLFLELKLSRCSITDDGIKMIIQTLLKKNLLKKLDLSENQLTDNCINALCIWLSHQRSLTSLNIADNQFTPESLNILSITLQALSNFHELNLSGIALPEFSDEQIINDPIFKSLNKLIKKANLTDLILQRCHLNNISLMFLSSAINKGCTINKFDIAYNQITDIELFFNHIISSEYCPITILNLSNNPISYKGLEDIAQSFLDNELNLSELYLSGITQNDTVTEEFKTKKFNNKLKFQGKFRKLKSKFKPYPFQPADALIQEEIESIDITNVEKSLAKFVEALNSKNCHVEVLDISYNKIVFMHDNITEILKELSLTLRKLKKVNLSHIAISYSSLSNFSNLLENNMTLEELILNENTINSKILIRSFGKHFPKSIHMSNCGLSNENILQFSQFLYEDMMGNIEEVDLSHNRLTDVGFNEFSNHIILNPTSKLYSLNISHNNISNNRALNTTNIAHHWLTSTNFILFEFQGNPGLYTSELLAAGIIKFHMLLKQMNYREAREYTIRLLTILEQTPPNLSIDYLKFVALIFEHSTVFTDLCNIFNLDIYQKLLSKVDSEQCSLDVYANVHHDLGVHYFLSKQHNETYQQRNERLLNAAVHVTVNCQFEAKQIFTKALDAFIHPNDDTYNPSIEKLQTLEEFEQCLERFMAKLTEKQALLNIRCIVEDPLYVFGIVNNNYNQEKFKHQESLIVFKK